MVMGRDEVPSAREVVALVAEETESLQNDVYREQRNLQEWCSWFPFSLGQFTLILTAVAFLLACASVVWEGGHAPGSRPSASRLRRPVRWPGAPLSARALFDEPDVHEVAAENLMRTGQGLLGPADRDMVLGTVAVGFHNMSRRLQQEAPEAAAALDGVLLSRKDVERVLAAFRLVGDPRVQRLGLDVARAVREGRPDDTAALRDRIEQRLRPRLGELRQLREELVQGVPLHVPAEDGERWRLALDPENLEALASVGGDWEGRLSREASSEAASPRSGLRRLLPLITSLAGRLARPGSEAAKAASSAAAAGKAAGVRGGAWEEGRALLRLIRLLVPAVQGHGAHAHWPAASTLAAGEAQQAFSCELAGATTTPADLARALACPLRLGAAGVDALQASRDLLDAAPGSGH